MIAIHERMGILAELVNKRPGLGKTAMMKMVFMLQQVYKVPLGYKYEIYTYGPYSAEVTNDIGFADQTGIISVDAETYPTGNVGYHLNSTEKTQETIDKAGSIVSENMSAIDDVIAKFGNCTAKELELSSTIVYMYTTYITNSWSALADDIATNVHEIKPHFSEAVIKGEYNRLKKLGILDKAA